MLPKYTVEYRLSFRNHAETLRYDTDGPVACTEFLSELLERGLQIVSVKHEGVVLDQKQADQLVKQAAGMLAARHVCQSLGIDAAEEHHRFGFAA